MQTQFKPLALAPLLRRAADLRGELIDTAIERDACANNRDEDGCCFDDSYGDLCDVHDAIEIELEQIEAEIEALKG